MVSYFINKSGEIELEISEFQVFGDFNEGLAPVIYTNFFWGFIDKSGNLAIETPFPKARNFSDGLAVVKTQEKGFYGQSQTKWGAIDKTGTIVFEGDFDKLYDFSEGLAVAEKADEFLFVEKGGEIIHSFHKKDFYFYFNGSKKFSDGLIAICDEKIQKCGFVNKTGDFVIEPQFESAANFSDGLARVSVKRNHREYLGFINRKGEYVIDPDFDIDCDFLRCSNDFSEGLASLLNGPLRMDKDPNFMFIDKSGKIVFQTNFFRAESFHEGLAVVWDEHLNKCGYIDKSGKLAIPLIYARAADFSEGLAHISFGFL